MARPKRDQRASWCALNHMHGPHGAKSPEPCPGWDEDPKATHRKAPNVKQAVKRDVERAVEVLNAKAERLGWTRRFRLDVGSHSNGVQHKLEHIVPELAHPLQSIPIGPTFNAAAKYLETFGVALDTALSERDRARLAAARGDSRMTHDPDARGVRRAGEGSI